jgi:hypothetical protein
MSLFLSQRFEYENYEKDDTETCAHHLNDPKRTGRKVFLMQTVNSDYW